MKISVLIPSYNAGKTIEATLTSVFAQQVQPDEILILNDGSTDDTLARLEKYKDRIVVLSQENSGVACARNRLVQAAQGDILAFLDADDLWHPSYLKIQKQMIESFPQAVGYFTWHDDFVGYDPYCFENDALIQSLDAKVISPADFVTEYIKRPMRFQMSCFCMPKRLLEKLDSEPFSTACVQAEDTYLHNMLPLWGSIVHTSMQLVAYRIVDSSLSANRLEGFKMMAVAYEKLDAHYKNCTNSRLHRAFNVANASAKRTFGKLLMHNGKISEARNVFYRVAFDSPDLFSTLKSLGLFCLAWLPSFAQTRYPLRHLWSRNTQRIV